MTARRSSSHLLIPLTPTDNAHAASKKYVDDSVASVVGGGGPITIDSVSGLQDALDDKAAITYVDAGLFGKSNTGHTHIIDDVSGLQTTLDAKAVDSSVVHLAGTETITGDKTFSGTVSGITKAMVGLGNVNNTADLDKPISTATQTALDDKQTLDSDLSSIAGLTPTNDDIIQRKSGAWINRSMSQLKTDLALTKSDVGLGSVTNNSQYYPGGTDVAVTDGGTGASTAADARTNLGLVIGTHVQAYDVDLDTWATKTPPSGTVVGTTDTQTLTNKRVTPRVLTQSNVTSLSVNSDNYDYVTDTGLTGAVTLNNPTGTPTEGQRLWYALTGTASRAISYGTAFEDSGNVTRPTTTSGTARLDIGFVWNSANSKWRCVGYA